MFTIARKFRALFVGVAALAVAFGAVALTPLTGVQADGWCWGDPVLSINGNQVSVNVGAAGTWAAVHANISMATITVTVPSNVPASIISMDPTSAIPETVVFVHTTSHVEQGDSFTALITVKFTALQTISAGAVVTYNGTSTQQLGDTTLLYSFSLKLH